MGKKTLKTIGLPGSSREITVSTGAHPGSKHCSSFTMTVTSSYCAGKACSTHLRIFAFGLELRGLAEVILIMLVCTSVKTVCCAELALGGSRGRHRVSHVAVPCNRQRVSYANPSFCEQ